MIVVRDREAIVRAVCERIRSGTPIKNAFALEGIPKRTAYDWMEHEESIRDAVDMARAEASENRRIQFEAAPNAAYLHFMQTLDPDAYPEPKQRIEKSGPDGAPMQHAVQVSIAEAVRIARSPKEDR
jgi:hypothetical protein